MTVCRYNQKPWCAQAWLLQAQTHSTQKAVTTQTSLTDPPFYLFIYKTKLSYSFVEFDLALHGADDVRWQRPTLHYTALHMNSCLLLLVWTQTK